GVTDNDNRLVAVGGTSDFDTTVYMNTYLRAFAVRFGNNVCNPANKSGADAEMITAGEKEPESEKLTAETKLAVYPNPVQDQLTVSNLKAEDFDKITVYNMQGAVILQQTAKGNAARLDVSSLPDGVYLLVLRSTVTLKEKSMKIVVRK
ncbi:MAG: T9SS type A sorting domain-containing protein, partial [Bacteroidota bacterium]